MKNISYRDEEFPCTMRCRQPSIENIQLLKTWHSWTGYLFLEVILGFEDLDSHGWIRFQTVLRFSIVLMLIPVRSVADPGCLSRIPDPTFFHPGSRIRTVSIPDPGSSSKNLSILTPKKGKKWFLSSKKYDPGCSSRIPDPDADFLPSRIQGSKRYPIPDPGSGSATLPVRPFHWWRHADPFSDPASDADPDPNPDSGADPDPD